MEYFLIKGEEKTRVEPERWVWRVLYNDGTWFKQFGDDGVFHQIGEVDQDRIIRAELYQLDDMSKRIEIAWCPGMRIVHRYRRFIFEAASPNERRATAYLFGWKLGGLHAIMCVLPDDRIVLAPSGDVPLSHFGI